MRASLSLSDMGLCVYLVEKDEKPGGWSLQAGRMGPEGQPGRDVAASLLNRIQGNDRIVLYTQAQLIEKTGSIGDFDVKLSVKGSEISLNVGAMIVTTGFTPYVPDKGEYGWGAHGVVDLLRFREMLAEGKLEYLGKPIRDVVFVYCVGSRQGGTAANPTQIVTVPVTAVLRQPIPPSCCTKWRSRRNKRSTSITCIVIFAPTAAWKWYMKSSPGWSAVRPLGARTPAGGGRIRWKATGKGRRTLDRGQSLR